MKLDDEVNTISYEAKALLAKATEILICELTIRCWALMRIQTKTRKNKRVIMPNDLSMAASGDPIFDFLIDILPRDEVCSK
jgi:hypothetical protein